MTKVLKLLPGATWALILLLGLAAGFAGARARQRRAISDWNAQAVEAAAAFSPAELARLTGSRDDLSSEAFRSVQGRLMRLQAAQPQARLVFLLRMAPGGRRAIVLADSQAPAAGTRFLPGDEIPGAAESAALQGVNRTGLAATDGPRDDPSGPVFVAYAPVSGPSGRDSPQPDPVLGLEISAPDWTQAAWIRGAQWASLAWLALGLPFQSLRSARRQREQRTALRNLLTAMEQSHSAVMIVNLESRIEYANAGLCEQIGYSRRELIGRSWRDFQQPETRPELLADMVENVRAGRPWSGEWFNRRKSGELYAVRGTITPVKDRRGRASGFVAVFKDMTEARRNESALRAALDRAEAGDRTKSRFLATMSHEVRTPLNGIVGFTGLLLETALTPEQTEYVQTIRTSGESLIQLTSDILDFARIESGGIKLELQPANPRSCLEDILDLLAVQAADKGIELVHWVDDDVPAVVMLDDSRLRQVLVNLVNNAVKFTEKGMVEVVLGARKLEDPAGAGTAWMLNFSVRDTGIGIAAESADLLFKPFRQVDETTTRRHGGTGLGLAISKNLVELMGGEIAFHSALGSGSVFSFSIPATEVPSASRARPDLSRLRVALAAAAGPFREEFTRLARRWGVTFLEFDSSRSLAGSAWDIAFVEIDEAGAREIASAPAQAWPVDRTYAVVPVSLESGLRVALRTRFRQLINKPLHHDAMASLMAGLRPAADGKEPGRRFGLNVLVVEDNLVNQRLVQKLLGNLGCTSTVAANGRIALEALARPGAAYDLALMDLHMPELDGLGAIERIRAGEVGEPARSIWITVLTADARAMQREKVMAAGADDYLVKPVSLPELGRALELFLESERKPARIPSS